MLINEPFRIDNPKKNNLISAHYTNIIDNNKSEMDEESIIRKTLHSLFKSNIIIRGCE